MWKVTRKGLIAHKLRFLLTAIAVILGVAFISGTFVFTATIQQTFDDLIANIYKGTDAQVRGPEVFKNDQGPGASPRPPIPASVEAIVRARARRRSRARQRADRLRADRRSRTARSSGIRGRARPRSASAGTRCRS